MIEETAVPTDSDASEPLQAFKKIEKPQAAATADVAPSRADT